MRDMDKQWNITTVRLIHNSSHRESNQTKLIGLQNSFGVTERVGNWSALYLTDRSRRSSMLISESSAVNDCSCGVPHGSVRGTLFIIYLF